MPILWVAARILIVGDEPEAASLSAQIIAGISYLGMSWRPELRDKWFATDNRRGFQDRGLRPGRIAGFRRGRSAGLTEADLATPT